MFYIIYAHGHVHGTVRSGMARSHVENAKTTVYNANDYYIYFVSYKFYKGFMSRFYSVNEYLVPVLAWGFLGKLILFENNLIYFLSQDKKGKYFFEEKIYFFSEKKNFF